MIVSGKMYIMRDERLFSPFKADMARVETMPDGFSVWPMGSSHAYPLKTADIDEETESEGEVTTVMTPWGRVIFIEATAAHLDELEMMYPDAAGAKTDEDVQRFFLDLFDQS